MTQKRQPIDLTSTSEHIVIVRNSGWRCRRKKVHVRYLISWLVSCLQ